MNNPLKEIMIAAGYSDFNETNRSYFCKAVNGVLSSSNVQIEVCTKGKVWTNKKTNKPYNLEVKAGGWTSKQYLQGGVFTTGILRTIGNHLQIPQVKEKILADVSLHTHCSRCGGLGRIPQFNYYCDGICFECLGTGMNKERDLVELK